MGATACFVAISTVRRVVVVVAAAAAVVLCVQ